jgi:hypothetical protein
MENNDRLRHPESGLPKFYNPSEHLAVDKVIVKFQGRVIFRQYIPKKKKRGTCLSSTYGSLLL